jgi:hypothetical protein
MPGSQFARSATYSRAPASGSARAGDARLAQPPHGPLVALPPAFPRRRTVRGRPVVHREVLGEGAQQQGAGPLELGQGRGLLQPAQLARVQRGAHQRGRVERDEQHARRRVVGLLEAEVEQHGIEVVRLLHRRELAGQRGQVVVAAVEAPPGAPAREELRGVARLAALPLHHQPHRVAAAQGRVDLHQVRERELCPPASGSSRASPLASCVMPNSPRERPRVLAREHVARRVRRVVRQFVGEAYLPRTRVWTSAG